MKWGFTKEVKPSNNISYEEKGWIYIRYFWKRVHNLIKNVDHNIYQETIKNADYLDKAMDYGNEVAKGYFKGEKTIKDLKSALERCFQAWLKLYNEIKQKGGVK